MIFNSIGQFSKAIAFAMAFLLCLPISVIHAQEDARPKHLNRSIKVYFALSDKHGFPLQEERSNFDCSDKIYAVIELTNFKEGKHKLMVVWTDPAGDDRERVEYDFHVRKEETRLWSWLTLKRSTGSGMLQWLNPAAGLEEFVGPWTVQFLINNRKIAASKFEVSC